MRDMEEAVRIFKEGGYTCVLVKGGEVVTSRQTGVIPLAEFIESRKNFNGFSAADKIVGRAAAFMYAFMGVCGVYADVMSEGAVRILKSRNIKYNFAAVTENIVNRSGDGLCPMERAVENISDCREAFNAVREKIAELKAQNS